MVNILFSEWLKRTTGATIQRWLPSTRRYMANFIPSACCNSFARSASSFRGASSEFYFRIDELLRQLADPDLHDIPTRLPFREPDVLKLGSIFWRSPVGIPEGI